MILDKKGRLRIGRVTKDVERGLHLSLSGDVLVYIQQKTLDKMAIDYPNKYLALLEECESIINKPDWAAFSDMEETLIYLKEYMHHDRFVKYAVSVKYEGTPRLFYFHKFWKPSEEELASFTETLSFARPTK